MAKILPFPGNNPEKPVSPEEKQLLAVYFSVVDESFMKRLRVVAWQKDPAMIRQEDGLPSPADIPQKLPSARLSYDASQATNNVIYLANRQEEQAFTEQQRLAEEALRRARREAA